MEYSKRLAASELARLGFQVDEIPVSTGKRADLRITDGQHAYHIEAKDKLDSDDIPAASQDDFYRRKDPLTHTNTISRVLRRAHTQLKGTPKADGTFQLIWFHAESSLQWHQAFATFYGAMWLSALYPNRDKSGWCFYFAFNSSFKMPDVEAMILTEGNGLHLCINEFSTRREEFKTTRLYKAWSEGEFDPDKLEATGQIIRCRSKVSRKNQADVIKALKEQAGVDFVANPLTRYSF
jgi:hypothetical protein